MTRVAVLLAHAQDPVVWRERHARGETLDATPYGYELAAAQLDLAWAVSAHESRLARAVRSRLFRALGFDLVHAWRNRRMLFEADVIWTHTEREHLAVALLQRLRRPGGRRKVPVVAQTVWLWDEWEGLSAARRRLVGWLLGSHDVEAVHSHLNLADSLRHVPGRRVVQIPFGSASVPQGAAADAGADGLAVPAPDGRPLVLAVGNDAHRDWRALRDAARQLPEVVFHVASKSRRAVGLDWPANVVVGATGSLVELSGLYRRADAVVVPLTPNRHVSGSTACIEALGARRPLVVTRVGGIEEYVAGEARTVEHGDVAGLAAALRDAVAGRVPAPSGDAVRARGLTQRDYVQRYVLLTRMLVGDTPWSSDVSRFAPVPDGRS